MNLKRWKRNTLGKLLFILSFISFIFLSYVVIANGLLPSRYRWGFILMLGLVQVFLGYYSFKPRVSKMKRAYLGLFSLLFFILMAFGGNLIHTSLKTLDHMNKVQDNELTYSMIVKKDSLIETWDDLKNKEIAWAYNHDGESLDKYKEALDKEEERLSFVEVGSYFEGAQDLLDEEIEVLLLNESYRELIDEQMEFSQFTRVITPSSISFSKVEVKQEEIKKDAPKSENFNIYISGIDTYGELSTVSRSDVNLIVTVNPKDHKILITTIPRDSYLPIAGRGRDGYDKLTHAGIYGISSSVQTIENFLDIDINYYARVNFSSLISVVDVLGGISVYNDQPFKNFDQGRIYLDGERALRFSRERYSLERGDFDRGINQTKVLTGIIEKALSPAILKNYNSLMDVVLGSTETNFPKEKIIEIINDQLDKPARWLIDSQQVKGQGQMGLPSYAMVGWNLYMFVPSTESIEDIKFNINSLE